MSVNLHKDSDRAYRRSRAIGGGAVDDKFEHYDDSDLPQRILARDVYEAIQRGESDRQIVDAVARGTDAAVAARCVSVTRSAFAKRPAPRWYPPAWLVLIAAGLAIIALMYALEQLPGGRVSARRQFKLWVCYAMGAGLCGYGIWRALVAMRR